MKKVIFALILAAKVLVLAAFLFKGPNTADHTGGHAAAQTIPAGSPLVPVVLPAFLTQQELAGKQGYEASCAACHGPDAGGRAEIAPPLIHKIYEPSHHGDESFQRAVALGVPAHHWLFGDMPPVVGLTRDDVTPIIAYVRAVQRVNGIK